MTNFLHQASFGLMILAAIVAAIVSIERIIFLGMNMHRASQLVKAVQEDRAGIQNYLGSDVVSEMVVNLLKTRSDNSSPDVKQDHDDAIYLHARDELSHRLWLLDTIVTAAPLLGLLGTIFGIVDTFLALSKSGMSDPSAVSAGIGTALYATALGISIALCGLIAFNFLGNQNERIGEKLKILILKI